MTSRVATYAADNDADLVIQLGDFGLWPGREAFIAAWDKLACPVMFIDGNHENHQLLDRLVAQAARPDASGAGTDRDRSWQDAGIAVGSNVRYLPRGTCFSAAGVRFVACGGARSIDRQLRRPGFDWFAQEAITQEDLDAVAACGPADVLLCHDAPSGFAIPGLLDTHRLPRAWRGEQPTCQAHRSVLRAAMESVQPTLVVHGHYHVRYQTQLRERWGVVDVHGLNQACQAGNMLLVDVDQGSWNIR